MYSMRDLKSWGKKRMSGLRVRETHRWTEEETNMLLEDIISAMKTSGNNFERPTARKFYTEFCTRNVPKGVDWMTKKHKLRHLKAAYIKAKEWKENVGSELFESDKQHISARIKKMCPYYNKLDEIFGPILNSDPIGPMIMEDESTVDNLSRTNINELNFEEEIDGRVIMKREVFDIRSINERDEADVDESETEIPENTTDWVPQSRRETHCHASENSKVKSKSIPIEDMKHSVDIEKMKLYFEREKFEINCRLENRKLNLEREKFEFEKTKFYETQKLRKYELDKQFELRNLEIQKDERIQRLEFEERTFNHNEN